MLAEGLVELQQGGEGLRRQEQRQQAAEEDTESAFHCMKGGSAVEQKKRQSAMPGGGGMKGFCLIRQFKQKIPTGKAAGGDDFFA
ncbi:MAG: hypothetical protein OHK0039_26840 [Bacteroidia bacterium]